MQTIWIVLAFGAVALLAFQLFVSWRVVQFKGYTSFQKAIQIAIIWLLPLVGALLVQLVMVTSSGKQDEIDRNFIPQKSGPTLSSFLSDLGRPR